MLKRCLVTVVAILLSGCGLGQPAGPLEHESKVIELDKSEMTRVELRMDTGELQVEGGSPRLLEADFSYNVRAWKPLVEYQSTGAQSDLKISQTSGARAMGHTENRWNLKLSDAVPMDVITRLGVGEAHMKLGSLNLRNVELNVGVGEVEMDLRGDPKRSYDVQIRGGVGEATVHLPANVGISATATGGIGDIDVKGLEERNGRWINPRIAEAAVTIRLDVKGGVGEIHLLAE
jgi:N-terminal domain of toast_rack, DUF2154